MNFTHLYNSFLIAQDPAVITEKMLTAVLTRGDWGADAADQQEDYSLKQKAAEMQTAKAELSGYSPLCIATITIKPVLHYVNRCNCMFSQLIINFDFAY